MTRNSSKRGGAAVALAVAALLSDASAYADTTTRPTLGAFSSLTLSGSFLLEFTKAATQSVTISGDAYDVEALQVAVRNGVLRIILPNGLDPPHGEPIKIAIKAPALTRLDTNGLVHAKITGLAGPAFSLDNHGAAAATLSGTVRRVTITSGGVASIDARGLHASDLSVDIRGQGVMLVFASHSAAIQMYGEGSVDVFGDPPTHQFKSLGYGVITMK